VKVTSATPAIAFAILIFYLPQKLNFWPCVKSLGNVKSSGGLVDWNKVEQKMPWGVLLLLAGGMYQKTKKVDFAISDPNYLNLTFHAGF